MFTFVCFFSAMSAASKNFYDAIGEVYECEWVAADDVKKAIDVSTSSEH